MNKTISTQIAVFGGGCFWCIEAIYRELQGIINVIPGYAGGTTPNPTYEQVCTGRSGHAEVIQIEFDPKQISYRDLLTVFLGTHDPTTLNRQGNDTGTQYRSIILTTTPQQKEEALAYIQEAQKDLSDPIVTEVKVLEKFYSAEENHKNYYARNVLQPYCQLVISPKLSKLREKFSQFLKNRE